MTSEEIVICILRAPGTNCDGETAEALSFLGCRAEIVHVNRLVGGSVDLSDFAALVLPGGFSYGDHVRSGAILARILMRGLGRDLLRFVEEGKPILGICNGFQVLTEMGLLPGFEGGFEEPRVSLLKNANARFEDRWVILRNEVREGKCLYLQGGKDLLRMPVAAGEGMIVLPQEGREEVFERLVEENQIALRYAREDGEPAKGVYPWNPNGSFDDIAGLCNPTGTILGMMPHPERAFHRITYPDWTREGLEGVGDGFLLFEKLVEFVKKAP
jgi:phosphoribosylformylglycinamidine synthase